MKRFKTYTIQWSLYFFVSLFFMGCQSLKQWQLKDVQQEVVELGAIVQREGALKNTVETKTLTQLQEDLRVSLVKKPITAGDLKRYQNHIQQLKGSKVAVEKPSMHLEIELIDDVGYAQAINDDQSARTYVRQAKKAGVVTKISLIGSIDPDVLNAQNYFLHDNGNGRYTIVYYDNNDTLQTVSFNEMSIFNYQVSHFCFGKDALGRIQVMDIVEEGKSCKRPLEEKPGKLQQTRRLIDY